jgi:excinuclease UvrABC helicase subunit UvrB
MAHMSDHETFAARAADARADADAATLDNVRERCLRAEAAWIAMADRAARNEAMRATLLAKKAADQAEAAAEAALPETTDAN